jgi:hypothetical protein
MSFQLNTATALPAEVQLGREKPQGAFCLRSRYSLSANSASSWNAGTTLSIPLQTGTPGTFTDVKQGVIQATVQIYNTNPYVDYLNFGPSGAMILFDEMRIYSSGTPIEENLRYSETADLLTIQGGHQCRPFEVYRRNNWRAANGQAGDKHVNFIKPAMVDGLGVPMYGRTPFMDKNSAVYCPPSIQFGIQGLNVLPNTISVFGASNNIAGVTNGVGGTGGLGTTVESRPFYDAGFSATAALNAATNIALNPVNAVPTNAFGYALVASAVGDSAANTALASLGKSYGVVGHRTAMHTQPFLGATAAQGPPSDHLPYKNTQFARSLGTDATNGALRTAAVYTPSQWPDYQPSTLLGEFDDEEVNNILGKAKVSEYMKYLCNVRNLPIGVRGNVTPLTNYYSATTQLEPAAPSATNAAAINYTQYRVSMPFLSGIYGIFAEKMFPDMLIGANNIRIEFKLAQNTKALWCTMDPCRRVPGTLRDFVPFTGVVGEAGVATARNIASTGDPYDGVPTIAPVSAGLGCSLAGVYFGGAYKGTSAIAGTEMYNTLSALGEDMASPQFCVGNTGIAAVVPAAVNTAAIPNTVGQLSQSALIGGFSYDITTNLPKPQWVPSATPWLKGPASPVSIVNENASCWGTYLPASQAQVRRCQMSTRLQATTDSFNNQGSTIFSIRDIQYIGEQVQLDDVVTSAIIQSAATSEIVVWTRGFRSFEAATDNQQQQNIILPIQIGQAEALYLLFRPATITTSYDYYSNSFYCPFVGLTYTRKVMPSVGGYSDVGGTYELNSSLDSASQGQFSYQLFSGTKQYPLQPIQTVSEMITEREKSIHSLHNWDWCTTENMSLCRWGSKYGATSAEQGLDYDPFIDFGYLTTFVPVYALDDQTITANPYLQVAEARESDAEFSTMNRVRGKRYPASVNGSVASGTFDGVLNEFLSPIGSFYLGWDFESWTNHQDMMRTGKFLGQEQLSIRMTGTFLCSAANSQTIDGAGQAANVMCIAIVPHVVKLSFVPGGHLLSYY